MTHNHRYSRWQWASLLFWAVWCLGHLTRWVPIPSSPSIRVYGHDVLLVVGLSAFLVFSQSFQKFLSIHLSKVRVHRDAGWMSLALTSSLILAMAHFGITPLLYTFRLLTYVLAVAAYYFIWRKAKKSGKSWLIFFGCLNLTLAWMQYLILPDTRFLSLWGYDDHLYRMIGPLFDPNYTGILATWLAMVILLIPIQNRIQKYSDWLSVGSYLLSLILTTGAVALSFSRASLLAFGVGIGALFWQTQTSFNRWVGVGVLIFGCLFVIFAPKPAGEGVDLSRTSSIAARYDRYTAVATGWQKQPVSFFIGTGLFSPATRPDTQLQNHVFNGSQPDSSVLFLLNNFGILGVFGVGFWILRNRAWLRNLSPTQRVLLLTLGAHSLFNNTLFEPFLFVYFWSIFVLSEKTEPTLQHSSHFPQHPGLASEMS